MTFASVEFLIFFAVVFISFFSLPDRHRNKLLLAASYFFYGYWSVTYLVLLIFTMVFDYVLALMIDSAQEPSRRLQCLTASIIVNVGILFIFKYFNLFADLVATLSGSRPLNIDLILPFGISFYTFHAMSYTIDVYRRVIPAEKNFTYYSCYVMFFPQLVAGPIARASHLLHQFAEPKRMRLDNFTQGFWLIGRGLIMKVVIADKIAPFVDAYYGNDTAKTPFLIVQAVYLFAFQIYFDFSGYTDMARGVAKFFDYELTLNFNRPYVATSITDFWRRWHISLSTWLRDYLYISLGGNRFSAWKTYRNLLVTMLLGGLWHGASWTFLFWGGFHGMMLALEKAWLLRWLEKLPKFARVIVVFHLVCFAWIFFRAETFQKAWFVIGNCVDYIASPIFTRSEFQIKLWVPVISWLIFEHVEEKYELLTKFSRISWPIKFAIAYGVMCFVILFAELNPKAFIYFQF